MILRYLLLPLLHVLRSISFLIVEVVVRKGNCEQRPSSSLGKRRKEEEEGRPFLTLPWSVARSVGRWGALSSEGRRHAHESHRCPGEGGSLAPLFKGGGRRRTSGQTGCQTRERRGDGSTEHGGTVIGKGERERQRERKARKSDRMRRGQIRFPLPPLDPERRS